VRPSICLALCLLGCQPPAAPPAELQPVDPLRFARPDRVMAPWADSLPAVAVSLGSGVVRSPGPAGWAALSVPEDSDLAEFLEELRVAGVEASAISRTRACAAEAARPGGGAPWHRRGAGAGGAPRSAAGVTLALLDTGLSGPAAAGALVSPLDLIDGDLQPDDLHQHGSHLGSLLVDPEAGLVSGLTLMPVRVLDEAGAGDELALADGIEHAVASGAQIALMGLQLELGAAPSPALIAALDRAAAAGVVLVAPSGNRAEPTLPWPAAHPEVIAVGALAPADAVGGLRVPEWSGGRGLVDLLAPGGDTRQDLDLDGVLDGVVAPAPGPGDPTAVERWALAGTSPAAALVAGAAAALLGAGAQPAEVLPLLRRGGRAIGGAPAPALHLDAALAALPAIGQEGAAPPGPLWAAVLPWPSATGMDVHVRVVDANGAPVGGQRVRGGATGPGGAAHPWTCVTQTDGSCAAPVAVRPDGIWQIEAWRVGARGHSRRPRAGLARTDAGPWALRWPDGDGGRWTLIEAPGHGPPLALLLAGDAPLPAMALSPLSGPEGGPALLGIGEAPAAWALPGSPAWPTRPAPPALLPLLLGAPAPSAPAGEAEAEATAPVGLGADPAGG